MRTSSRHLLAVASAGILIVSIAGPATAVDPAGGPDARGLVDAARTAPRPKGAATVGPSAFPGGTGEVAYARSPFNATPSHIHTLSGGLTPGGIGAGDSYPAYSPGGTRIAFGRDQTSDAQPVEDIYVMNADGSGVKRLTTSAADDYGPDWSPDGTRIVFSSDRTGNYEIWSMKYDGTDLRQLTSSPGQDILPSWSPDGTKIAFGSTRSGTDINDFRNSEIYVMNANGTGTVRLTTSPERDLWPDWSPDGGTITFASARTGDLEVYKMAANGTNVVNMSNDSTSDDFSPVFGPDGTSIVFTSDYYGDYDLWVVGTAGGDSFLLTDTADDEYHPTWQAIPYFALVDARFSPFQFDIEWLYEAGITSGCTAELFCADDLVTRGQMAAFLVRALGLPSTPNDYFTDDETSIFEGDINKLAASGITTGCNTGLFCPEGKVTRGQMAAFLARAYKLPATATDFFTDDASSIFQADINKLAASGITSGCTATTYCPTANVTRGQMAAFLNRAEN